MKSLSLFGLCVFARMVLLSGTGLNWTLWAPAAFFWQDAVMIAVFYIFEKKCSARWVLPAYWILVLLIAVNLPLLRIFSSPLTLPMIRGAGGPLSDSIAHYLTPANLSLVVMAIVLAVILPPLVRTKLSPKTQQTLVGVLGIMALLGPIAGRHIETNGLDRNYLYALARGVVPRVSARAALGNWRDSHFRQAESRAALPVPGSLSGRNLVFIILESASARYLKPYGAAADPMPNLTRLAAEGVVFQNAYAVYPESIKGLFSVLCSQYPAMDAQAEDYAFSRVPSITEVLAADGFRTALFHSGRFAYLGMEGIVGNRGFDLLADAGDIGGNAESSFGIDEFSTVDRMLSWVNALKPEDKFCLFYLPIAGHHPYESPVTGPFPGETDEQRYLQSLFYADQALGRLISGFVQSGLMDESVFVIFGDHGEAFGEHTGNYGHTFYLYEENIKVPFVIAVPGLAQSVQVERPISLIDVGPTVLDLVGMPIPTSYQGVSALQQSAEMTLFFTDYSLGWLGLRDGDFKYLYLVESGGSKLFDLRNDPFERKNLADQFPERVEFYRSHLKRWSSAQRSLLLSSQ